MQTFTRVPRGLALAFALIAFAGGAAGAPQVQYQAVHSSPFLPVELVSLERTPDGGVVTVGTYGPSLGVMLVKNDALGNTLWKKLYAPPGMGTRIRATCVRVASDGDYVIAGEIDSSVGNEILLMKVAPGRSDCTVRWARTYWGTGFTSMGGTVVRERSGGGYAIVGRKAQGCGPGVGGVLILTNKLGVQQQACCWTDLGGSPDNALSFNDVREEANGDVVVVGWLKHETFSPTRAVAMRTVGALCGPLRWSKSYGTIMGSDDNEFFGEGMEIVPPTTIGGVTSPGYYLLTGPWRAAGAAAGSFLFTLDPNLGVLATWSTTTNSPRDAQSVRVLPDRSAILAGTTLGSDRGNLELFNALGVIAVGRQLIGPTGTENEFIHEAIPMPDGTFAYAAATDGYAAGPFGEGMTARTDSVLHPGMDLTGFCDIFHLADQTFEYHWQELTLYTFAAPESEPVTISCVPIKTHLDEPCTRTGPCYSRPAGITLWLPFDEPTGLIAANGVNGAHPGAHVGPPLPTSAGKVDGALNFNGTSDYVNVATSALNPYPQIDPGSGSFTIDAWIRRTSSATGVENIVDHRDETLNRGYHFFLNTGNTLGLQLANGAGFTNYSDPAGVVVLPDGQWHLVAVTASRADGTQGGRFFIDGEPTSPEFPIGNRAGNIFTPLGTPFRVGARSTNASGYFSGGIDEVEFFRRALERKEIRAIFDAGRRGKCKNSCKTQTNVFCDPGQASVVTKMQICNHTTSGALYNWTVTPLPVEGGCDVAGPTVMSATAGPLFVPSGVCLPVMVTINRPAGLTYNGAVGCYLFQATNTTTGEVFGCIGKVVDARDWWPHFNVGQVCDAVLVGPSGKSLEFEFTNMSESPRDFPVRLTVREADFDENEVAQTPAIVGLFGAPPGVVTAGVIPAPPLTSFLVSIPVAFTCPDAGGLYTIFIEADLDGDGDYEPAATQLVAWSDEDEPAPADAEADFSLAANPNGNWSYRYIAAPGQPSTLLDVAEACRWRPSSGSYPDVNICAGQLTMAPDGGDGATPKPVIIRWTAPHVMSVSISGSFAGYYDEPGLAAPVSVLVRGVPVFEGTLGPASEPATVFEHATTVAAGDTIDFVVDADAAGRGHRAAVTARISTGLDVVLATPSVQRVCRTGSVTLAVTATGGSSRAYQWRHDGVSIDSPAARSSSLAITGAIAADAGSYDCVITSPCETVTSDAIALTVCASDFNCSGAVSPQDIFDFLAAFFDNDPRADINGVGGVTVQDIFDYLAAFFTPCP